MEGKEENNQEGEEMNKDSSEYETAEDESSNDDTEEDTTSDSSDDDTTALLGTKQKKKPKRCQHSSCRSKLLLTSYSCYCERYFCSLHTPPEEHSCDFDYKAMAKKKIKKDNPKCVKEKVKQI